MHRKASCAHTLTPEGFSSTYVWRRGGKFPQRVCVRGQLKCVCVCVCVCVCEVGGGEGQRDSLLLV